MSTSRGLSEDSSLSVLLLEAGKDFGPIEGYPRELAQANLSAFSVPGNPHSWPLMAHLTPDLTYPITRGKLVGGSSAVNGAVFLRGHQADYDSWSASGSPEWSYEKVLPFLKRQETDLDFGETDIHGGSGPIPVGRSDKADLTPVSEAFVEACLALDYKWDIDMNGRATGGVGLVPHNTVGGVRQNVATHYLEPAKTRRNLTVIAEALVHRVVFQGARATGVEASWGGSTRTFSGDEIVLCCGAIKTPQLLMLSGIGPREVLRRLGIDIVYESPYVGKNLMDHPGIHLFYRTEKYQPEPGPTPLSEVAGNFQVANSGDAEVRIYPFLYSRTNQLLGVFRSQPIATKMRTLDIIRQSPSNRA